MDKRAIIVFMKKPVPGRVKTRLAKKIGFEAAAEVYKELLQKTRLEIEKTVTDVFVFYHPELLQSDVWDGLNVNKLLQSPGDLGSKMKNAFRTILALNYDKVLIIGTDCYALENKHLEQAFEALNQNEIVIGPSNDGGYYLLGMKQLFSPLFENKMWSTPEVFPATIHDCKNADKSFSLLPILTDIDEWEDLIEFPELLHTVETKINS